MRRPCRRAPSSTTQARLALRVLSEADVAAVHAAALELLGAEGAAAEAAAQSAPSAFVLAGRVPEHDVALGAGRVWLAAGAATAGEAGVPERVRRLAGGDSVPATAADLDEAIRLADALPEVAVARRPAAARGRRARHRRARALPGRLQQARAGRPADFGRGRRAGRRAGGGRRRLRRRGAPPPAALALRRRRRAGCGARLRPRRTARRAGARAGRCRRRRPRSALDTGGDRGDGAACGG